MFGKEGMIMDRYRVVVFPLGDERGQLGTGRVRKISNLRVHTSGCSPGTFK